MANILEGTIAEIRHDEQVLTLRLAPTVDIELSYEKDLNCAVGRLMESCEVEVKAEITGWADRSYPHLSHDVMKGVMSSIEEVW